jgi:hypothetical protein
MSLNPKLHQLLIARQSTKELERKRKKAWRKCIWTQEDFDFAERSGLVISLQLFGVLRKQ